MAPAEADFALAVGVANVLVGKEGKENTGRCLLLFDRDFTYLENTLPRRKRNDVQVLLTADVYEQGRSLPLCFVSSQTVSTSHPETRSSEPGACLGRSAPRKELLCTACLLSAQKTASSGTGL
jgi:hypothetical protein